MRQAALLLAVLLCPVAPALAQVTVDLHALDALPGAGPPEAERAPARHPPAKAVNRPRVIARKTTPAPPGQQATALPTPPPLPAATATVAPAVPVPATTPTVAVEPPHETPAPPPATLPTAPPAIVALAPIPPPPPPEAAPTPPPPVSDTAASAATTIAGGLRVTFGAGQTDLSAASAAAIADLVRGTPANDNTSFNVVAYAAGTPEDPSTARRLSLSRALAVRSALMAGGVGSARIYVRALGSATATAPADRVDLTVMGGNTPAAIPTSAPAPLPPRQSQQP